MNASATHTAHDPYPTRSGGPETMSPRLDPVVNGTDGPLDAEQLRRYDQDGFLLLDGLFSADIVARCVAELDRLASLPHLVDDPRIILEPGSAQIKSIFEIHAVSEFFRELVTSRPLVDRARQILGSDVYIHQTRVNQKPGFCGTEFYWHSDFETWHAEDGMPRMRALSFVVALTENLPVNGPLMIVSGSHQRFVTCPGATPQENYRTSLVRQEVGLPSHDALRRLVEDGGIVQCLTPPGGAVLFDSNCMHGSAGNITPYPRKNLFVVFNSVDNALTEPFAAPGRRPRYLAARDFTPV